MPPDGLAPLVPLNEASGIKVLAPRACANARQKPSQPVVINKLLREKIEDAIICRNV
jgi:hypothetical protein